MTTYTQCDCTIMRCTEKYLRVKERQELAKEGDRIPIPSYEDCSKLYMAQERKEGVCGLDGRGRCSKAKGRKRRISGTEIAKGFLCF